MAKQSGLRARDIDRSTTATALDNAYADGQLSYEEHRLRLERARAAVTLGELDALVADLQVRTAMPPRAVPSARRGPGVGVLRWAVATVGLLALAALVWFVVRTTPEDDEPVAAATTTTTTTSSYPAEVTPIFAPRVDFAAAAGYEQFVDLYRARFGDTISDNLNINIENGYASFTRAEELDRERDFTFRGGFDTGDLAARETNTQVIDIATVSPETYAALLQQAVERTALRDAYVTHVMMRTGRTGPEISVYVTNNVSENEYIIATFDGRIIR